jgi:hypothetical protein
MARRKIRAGQRPKLDQMRVQLIPVVDKTADADKRSKIVQHLISMMFINLHRRGRPKKVEEELAYAA